MQPGNIDLNYLVPTVASDGSAVLISETNVPTVIFFEARKQSEAGMQADVVASVRFSSVADLEALQNTIAETIEKHKTREK